MNPSNLCLVMIFAGVLSSTVCESRAQSEDWEQIRAAIEARRAEWGRFRCQLNTVRVLPEAFQESAPTTLPEYSDGMFIVEGQLTAIVDISGRRFHKSDRTPIYSVPQQQYVTRNAVTVFDGTDAFTYYPDHETGTFTGKGPYDLTRDRLKTARVRQFVTGPLFWSLGVFEPDSLFSGDSTDLQAQGFRFTRSGSFVVARGKRGRQIQTYTFDPEKDWNVVHAEFRATADKQKPERVTTAYEIQLRESEGFWFPDQWQKSFRDAGEESVAITEMRRAGRLDESAFTVPEDYLQPGMVVSDAVEHQRYVVGEDGQQLPYVSGAPMRAQDEPGAMIFLTIVIVVTWICAAVFIKARWRTT